MTTQQIILISCLYLVELVVVVYFTRATSRRIGGGLSRWGSRRVFRDGRDRPRQRVGVVASADRPDTILPRAVLPRALDLSYTNLPGYVAVGPAVRLAWVRGVHLYRGDHRPAAGLPVRGDLPGVDGVRAGRCTHHRRRRDLCW